VQQKTVKSAILKKALRAMSVETLYTVAPEDAYEYAFEEYLNMLASWSFLQGINLEQYPPRTMDDTIGNLDPNYELWTCLLPRIADYFIYDLTQKQANDATASLRKLRNRSSKRGKMKEPKNQPRGSGNNYYRSYRNHEGCNDVCE
jgi:hypothetical protein